MSLGFLSLCIFYSFKPINIILVLCEAVVNLKKKKRKENHLYIFQASVSGVKVAQQAMHIEKEYSIAVRWNPAKGAPCCLARFRTSQDEAEVKIGIENSKLNSFLYHFIV